MPAVTGDSRRVDVVALEGGRLDVVVDVVVEVVVVLTEALLHPDSPRPTAVIPRAASSLRTMRGYLWGSTRALSRQAPVAGDSAHRVARRLAQLSPAVLQM